MKKLLIYITILLSNGHSQFDLYPVTDFFGGGIGYSPMYINIDEFPATDLLEGLGLEFLQNLFAIIQSTCYRLIKGQQYLKKNV